MALPTLISSISRYVARARGFAPNFLSGQDVPLAVDKATGALITTTSADGAAANLAVAVTSASYAPGYTAGDDARLAVDKASGGLLTHGRALAAVTDFVSARGNVAHDAPDDNFPISIGGRAVLNETSTVAVVVNDRVNAWFDTFGRQVVKTGGKDIYTFLSSSARTTTQTSGIIVYKHTRGLIVFLKVTAVSGAPSLVVSVGQQNPIDGTFSTGFTFNAVTGTGSYVFKIYPGITPVAGVSFNDVITAGFNVVVTPGTADSITYSLGYELAI
jgi:hypothetical protein